MPQSVVILADETAEWKVAGLRQIERISLAVNDFLVRLNQPGAVFVHICGSTPIPHFGDSLTKLTFTSNLHDLENGDALVISTRLVLGRESLEQAFANAASREQFPALIRGGAEVLAQLRDGSGDILAEELDAISKAGNATQRTWSYLDDRDDIERATDELFRTAGKSQDGLISRFVNRPLSRSLSRLLIRLPILPNQWTLLFMALPLAGGLLLLRGDYLGFAMGAILFQLHSALDGCDGEIARLKYLESDSGGKLDAVCDRLSTLVFAAGLGIGLARQPGISETLRWFYAVEGITAAILIGIAETWLTRKEIEEDNSLAHNPYGSFVAGHRQSFNKGDQLKLWMIKGSGMLSLGERAASFFGELTKRDVFNFVFMMLAVCGFAQWVLHILAACACAIVVLALKEALTPRLDVNPAA